MGSSQGGELTCPSLELPWQARDWPAFKQRRSNLGQPPQVHEAMMEAGAYPSPLNYYNFPKSVCTSVNEVGSTRV